MKKLFPIYEKQGMQIQIRSLFLWMFSACFIVWQLGVLFYSGTTMSLFGRTPISLIEEDTTLIIGIGYLASIAFICFFPRKTVYAERVVLPVALIASALMLFPFSPAVTTLLFYIEIFGCVFSIGTMASLASHLFTLETTWRDAVIGVAAGGTLIAILQNDFLKIGFTGFTLLSIIMIAAQMLFYFLLPAKIEVSYASHNNNVKMPKILFGGIWMLIAFSTLLLCLASSFAESFTHGTSIFYISGAVFALLAGYLKKRRGGYVIKTFSTYFILTVAGFILAAFSMQLPLLKPIACIFLGFIVVLVNFWIFLCAAAFKFYPTRFIGAIGAGVGLLMALIHSRLLETLRDNIIFLYGLYAVLAFVMMLCYYFLEPYFIYAWQQTKEKKEVPLANGNKNHSFSILSEQERILADLILRGYTASVIALEMNITLNTQKSYRKRLYEKLDIHSKRELFELAEKK